MDIIALDSRLKHERGFLGRSAGLLIDGTLIHAASGKSFPVLNPATGTVIMSVPEADKEDVNRAVAAARRAFDDGKWHQMGPSARGQLLWKLADLVEKNLEELAELESLDNGKPHAVARVADLPLTVDMFRYMARWANKICRTTLPLSLPGEYLSYTVREPAGVADIASKIKVGPGLDPATEMGPLVSEEQFARVTSYIEDGRSSGAKIAVGGNRVGNLGDFVAPTVLENTTPDMTVIQEEIFGPVVCATPFGDDDIDSIASAPTTPSTASG